MPNLWKRIAAALFAGFASFVLAFPLACGSLLLCSQHVDGDIDSGGPSSMLGGIAIALILAIMVTAFTFWKTTPRR